VSSTTSRRGPLIAAIVVGATIIAAVRLLANGGGGGAADHQEATAAGPRAGCTTVTVVASSEKAGVLAELAGKYNEAGRPVSGGCGGARVVTKASGDAEQALARGWDESLDGPRPDVWSPAASTWVGLLRQDLAVADKSDILPARSESVVTTPLVIAMPEPMAKALGWPHAPIGWSDALSLVTNPRGWAAKGHPEWGRFTLGKTHPGISTSGLAATIGAFVAATGRSSDLTRRDLADAKVRKFVAGVESGVLHYGDTTLTFLANLQRADDAGQSLGYVSAVAVEEKSVLDYNAGNPSGNPKTLGQHAKPKVPLVAIYPREGTLMSDNPFVVLEASWADAQRKAVAADFLTYLRSSDSQRRLTEAGFRTFDGKPGASITDSKQLIADQPKVVLNAPAPAVLAGVRSTWEQVRKRARVLLLMDVSGSMGEAVPSAGASRLQLAQRAALNAAGQFSDTDEVGLWAFTTDLPSGVYAELVPVQRLGPQRQDLREAIEGLTPLAGTPLYAATRRAVDQMRLGADPSKINAVVLLTDGRNEYPDDTDVDGLVRQLAGASVESGIRVFSIAYGDQADLTTLRRISEASRAAVYDATNAANIDKIFTAVIANF
jgi:Ca-activated chloride channel family protein